MKAVIQRVESARLSVGGKLISEIGKGLVVYFGVAKGDDISLAAAFAKKIAAMRIFEDADGKMNYSCMDIGGEILSVSQFTLLASCAHGNRPDFLNAELPEKANEIYERFSCELSNFVPVKRGVFGADMTIEQINRGPVTIIYEK